MRRDRHVSVIMPVLNEEARIGEQLEQLRRLGMHTVIVVDGGSTDATPQVVEQAQWPRLIRSQPGRATQMNAGAAEATGEILLFLHADVGLPDDALSWIDSTMADWKVVAGAFRTRTTPDKRAAWFAPLLRLADLRSRYTRLPYGDQAIFVRAETFRYVGGYPDVPILEDRALCAKLRRTGQIRIVPANVRVSGRRFLARPLYYTLAVNLIPLAARLGVSPHTLSSWYGQVR